MQQDVRCCGIGSLATVANRAEPGRSVASGGPTFASTRAGERQRSARRGTRPALRIGDVPLVVSHKIDAPWNRLNDDEIQETPPLRKCSELLNVGHTSAAAEDTVNVNCHWLISPAWCYAMATLDLLEEEQLRRLKKVDAAQQTGSDRL